MHRLFIAIRPPEDIRDLLIDAMDDGPALRWVGDEQLHLTLRFVGEVERPVANDVASALDKVRSQAFDLSVLGAGMFQRKNGGTLWAGVQPKETVAALAAKIERAVQQAGLEPEHRSFLPHITLARWNGRSAGAAEDFVRRNSGLRSATFRVSQFILFESRLSRHGALYEDLVAYPLS